MSKQFSFFPNGNPPLDTDRFLIGRVDAASPSGFSNYIMTWAEIKVAVGIIPSSTSIEILQSMDGVDGEDGISIKGDTGIAGAAGAAGAQGIQGIQGIQGNAGADGTDGTDGLNGLSITGQDGEDGNDGVSIQGPVGVAGANGATGASGVNGLTIIGQDGLDADDPLIIPGKDGISDSNTLAIMLESDPPEEQITIPGPIGTIGDTGIQGSIGPAGVMFNPFSKIPLSCDRRLRFQLLTSRRTAIFTK